MTSEYSRDAVRYHRRDALWYQNQDAVYQSLDVARYEPITIETTHQGWNQAFPKSSPEMLQGIIGGMLFDIKIKMLYIRAWMLLDKTHYYKTTHQGWNQAFPKSSPEMLQDIIGGMLYDIKIKMLFIRAWMLLDMSERPLLWDHTPGLKSSKGHQGHGLWCHFE